MLPARGEERRGEEREKRKDKVEAPPPVCVKAEPEQKDLLGEPVKAERKANAVDVVFAERQHIFDVWVTAFKRDPKRSKFRAGDQRDKAIIARLRDGFTVSDLIESVQGHAGNPWRHQAAVRNELKTLLRPTNVEAGLEEGKQCRPPGGTYDY